jgi:putative ATP-dependent endonuclease of the OLD family
MTHRLDVSFQAYNPSNFFHALRLQALEGDAPRTLAELGTGEQQILALSFAYAYATAFHRGIVLVIEEPEAHLHPLAQQWLAKYMMELTAGGLQIVLTTHSAHFIDIENIEGIVRVHKTELGTTAAQITRADLVAECVRPGVPQARIDDGSVLPFYAAVSTPQILEGLFAKSVILVEGPTEALALPIYMERVGFIPSKEGVAVLPVGGKGNLAKWRRLFNVYGIPTYVVFDNDGTNDDRTGVKRSDALASMSVPPEEFAAVLTSVVPLVNAEYMVFPHDYEASLREMFPSYETLEQEGRDVGVDSKPFLARWVAQRLEIDESPGWDHMRQFAGRIRATVPEIARMPDRRAPRPAIQPGRRAPRRRDV